MVDDPIMLRRLSPRPPFTCAIRSGAIDGGGHRLDDVAGGAVDALAARVALGRLGLVRRVLAIV